jgi:two-component sensor histidine kinase
MRRLAFSITSAPDASMTARKALLPLSESLSAERFSDLKLILTELITNSVAHGPGGLIDVSVEMRTDGSVYGTVADEGQGISLTGFTPTPEKGLGLLIVDTLAGSWGVQPEASEIWFVLDPPSQVADPQEAPLREQ